MRFPKRYEMKCRIKNKQMSPDSNLCARIKPIVFSSENPKLRIFALYKSLNQYLRL